MLNPKYPEKLLEIGIELLEPYKTSSIHHKMKCLLCNHVWKATPKSKIQNYKKHKVKGCPKCTIEHRSNKKGTFKEQIEEKGLIVIDLKEAKNRDIYVDVKNPKCGHIFNTKIKYIIQQGVNCPICNNKVKKIRMQKYNNQRHAKYLETATEWQAYQKEVRSASRLNYNKYRDIINPLNLKIGRAGSEGAHHVDHIFSIKKCFDLDIPVELCSHIKNLQVIPWLENITDYCKPKHTIPYIFHNYIESDSIVNDFIKMLYDITNGMIETNSDIIYPYAIHGIIPHKKIAFHLCTYLECYQKNTNDTRYNLNLLQDLEKQDFRLIQIYQDEFLLNRALIESKIRHIVGFNESTSIYARKCKIRFIKSNEKTELLNKNHTQGNDNASISIGAFYDEKLVSVMTFTEPRVIMGGKKKVGVYELSRFVTDVNFRIIGIAGKLLSFFKKNHDWVEIYSYADRRWSNGNLYNQLRFDLIKINPPSYSYIIDGIRKHRWAYRKDALSERYSENYDKKLTEYQNMLNLGYDRVWDCGTLKFSITNKNA